MVSDNSQDETMEVDEPTISPPDPSMIEELITADYSVPSDIEEDSLVEEVPHVNSDSESDSECDDWEVIENGTEKGKPKLVNKNGYSYVISRVRNVTRYWVCSVRNKNVKCKATVTEKSGVLTASNVDHCHQLIAGATKITKMKAAFKE